MTPKHLGTLNVDAGEAGTVTLDITTATPLERIAAVLRFADDMTAGKSEAVSEAVSEADPPPVVAKQPKAARRVKTSTHAAPKSAASLECDECGRSFAAPNSIKIHKGRVHKPELKSAGADQALDDIGPDAELHRCGECDFIAPVTAFGSGIGAHTRLKHHREPTFAEKTPRTQSAAEEATG